MKICRNNFDIHFGDVLYCYKCSFKIGNECKWLRIVGAATTECGGIKSNNLSDIFIL